MATRSRNHLDRQALSADEVEQRQEADGTITDPGEPEVVSDERLDPDLLEQRRVVEDDEDAPLDDSDAAGRVLADDPRRL